MDILKLQQLQKEKQKLLNQEQQLKAQRKAEIAELAEHYGLIHLSDEELKIGFQNLLYHSRRG